MNPQDWIALGLFAVTAWYAVITNRLLKTSRDANDTADRAVGAANAQLDTLKQELAISREQLEVQERHLWSQEKLAICASVLAEVDRTSMPSFQEERFASLMLAAASKLVLVGEPTLARSVRDLIQPTIKAFNGSDQGDQQRKQLADRFTAEVSDRLAVKQQPPHPTARANRAN